MKTLDLNQLNVQEIPLEETIEFNGGYNYIYNLVAAAAVFAYNLGKDSYAIHPESLI